MTVDDYIVELQLISDKGFGKSDLILPENRVPSAPMLVNTDPLTKDYVVAITSTKLT